MVGLEQAVYDSKLIPIPGTYRQQTPLLLLAGVGPATAAQFAELGIHTIGDLLQYKGELSSRLGRIPRRLNTPSPTLPGPPKVGPSPSTCPSPPCGRTECSGSSPWSPRQSYLPLRACRPSAPNRS